MRVPVVRWLAMLLGVVSSVAALSAVSAQAYTPGPSPSLACSTASQADLAALESSLSPADAATVTMGTPVTFSGASGAPLTFALGSGTPLLHADIDSGAGTMAAGSEAEYVFTSTNASAIPRTIFWTASFSDASFPDCAGQLPIVYATAVRSLTVLPPPTTSTTIPAPAPAPASLQASIGVLGGFRIAHPSISFSVDCTASCSGETRSLAYLVRGHAHPVSVPALDYGPSPVSIPAAAGGAEHFTHHYTGRSLRILKRLLHAGGSLELKLDAKLTGPSGAVVQARRTTRLG